MPSCGAETHLFFSHLAIDASDTSASRTWGPCRPASPIAPSEASYEGRNELEECLDNDGRSVASTVCVTKRHKTSRFGLFTLHFSQPCDSYNLARPAFHETMPVAAARWLSSSARHSHARPSLRDHDPLPTAHTLIISISLPAGSVQRAATNEKNFGDEENSLTSKNSRILAHTHHHCYKHI